MNKRATKKGHYLRFQRLFYIDRGKLPQMILNDIEALKCKIPSPEVNSVFKSAWETPGVFKGFGKFKVQSIKQGREMEREELP